MIEKEQDNRIVYSDGDVEEQICNYLTDHGGSSDGIIDTISESAVFHNFTPARENLLKWYPFKKGSHVLEIGAGMGALTPFLASVCEKVVALEPSSSRAGIIAQRCQNYPNVQVIVQPLDAFTGQEASFDYVTLIGVLEYAGVYGKDINPWKKMLSQARRFLKPDGKLLIAIENKFGLKYWCGAAEDHTGIPFDSINNYSKSNGATGRYTGSRGVRTFSKAELEILLKESGFFKSKFYYALPDYKFPMLILTDESESADTLVGDVKYGYPAESTLIANELKLYPEIVRNNTLAFFANSYFIEALLSDDEVCSINTVTIKRDYKAQYRILTAIDHNSVVRFAANKESQPHILQLISATDSLLKRGIPCIAQENCGNGITKAFKCTAPRADTVFMKAVQAGDMALIKKMLDLQKHYLLMSSDYYQQDGKIILKTGYIDLTFRNSFWQNEDLLFFDQEWAVENVPLSYILYRSIKYAIMHASDANRELYYEYCGITQTDLDDFAVMESHFLNSLMDDQMCQWMDQNLYHSGLELESIIAQKMQNKEGHIEQLLQSERDLLAENEKKAASIQQLQYELGYQTSMADHFRKSEQELQKQLEETRRIVDRLQYELGNKVSENRLLREKTPEA